MDRPVSLLVLGTLVFAGASPRAGADQPAAVGLIQPADLVYEGAFWLPNGATDDQSWAYTPGGLTYMPNGDPTGPSDGYPGSLVGPGHDWFHLVGEASIPVPVISTNPATLPVATQLHPFVDLTGGLLAGQGSVDTFGDVAYLEAQGAQTSDKIYWTAYEYYNVSAVNYLSHGWAETNLSSPQAQGLWRLGSASDPVYHAMRTSDYMCDVPRAWADTFIGGRYLVSGRSREAGCCGGAQGPALFAFAPWQDGNPPAYGAELGALPLLYYPEIVACIADPGQCLWPDYRACDNWQGLAWLEVGGSQAVVVSGTKALGANRYGLGDPGDCDYGIQGYHCDPYVGEILFYDPNQLAEVAAGTRDPWSVLPYAYYRPVDNIGAYLLPSCQNGNFRGAAFDRARALLYVQQVEGEDVLVHVFRVSPGSTSGVDHVVGEGLGDTNGNRVRAFGSNGAPTSVDFQAYGAGKWGTVVGSGEIDGGGRDEILTGPGPGAIYGPQARAFRFDGTPVAKVSFYAYGTLRYGVNVGSALLDGDAFAEILTGPGPGAVFGPHARAFDYDGVVVGARSGVSFYAYGTLKWGVNVTGADVEGDGYGEIVTGPGPGVPFGPQARGFDVDGGPASAIGAINFQAFALSGYGLGVAGGDVDGDGFDEIAATPGPAPTHQASFAGFDHDGAGIAPAPGFTVTPFTTLYGGRIGAGDVDVDGRADLLAGAGRDPAADSTVRGYAYSGSALTALPGTPFLPFTGRHGVNVAAGALGY